jgi:hypothetical protein
VPAVERASQDRYLLVFAGDARTAAWLKRHWPDAVVEQP